MKDTYNFPKTLRNYDENNVKVNSYTSGHHNTKIQKSMSSSNFKYPKTVQEQNHEIGDYYVLTNPSQFKSKQNKKKSRSKPKKISSRLSQALKDQLSRPLMTHSQIGPQNIVHCKSLEKLQIISNDRSQQIKALIQQKAYLIAENQELKAKLINPTFREQEFIQKIAQREFEMENLKQNLKRKEQRIQQIQKDHKLQIQRLKHKHREEITGLREEMNKLRVNKIQSSKTYNTTASYEAPAYNKNIQPQQPQIYRLSDPKASELKTTYYRSGQLTTLKQDNQPQHLQSDTYKPSMKTTSQDKSPLRQTSNKADSSLPYRTFVGEDGYERRVYTVNKENDALKVSSQAKEMKTTIPSTSSIESIQPIRYLNSNPPFTNEKITSNIRTQNLPSQNAFVTSSYNYQKGNSEQGTQKESNLHNQILYSKSLTFQCFNDSN